MLLKRIKSNKYMYVYVCALFFTHSFRRYADLYGLEVSSLCTDDYGPNFALANVTANVKVVRSASCCRVSSTRSWVALSGSATK